MLDIEDGEIAVEVESGKAKLCLLGDLFLIRTDGRSHDGLLVLLPYLFPDELDEDSLVQQFA